MTDRVEILAILGRTAEGDGVSRPFRCEGEDGIDYFVKLKNAGYVQLVKEWVAGRLAHEMSLPVADIRMLNIDHDLIAGNPEYESELGSGTAFGSARLVESQNLVASLLENADPHDLSRIHLFDWWVHNGDRYLTKLGGNPNLRWDYSTNQVVMIDHDNAFDQAFDPKAFKDMHALRGFKDAWKPQNRGEMEEWLEAGLLNLDRIWEELPEEWFEDEHGIQRCRLGKDDIQTVLASFRNDPNFWNID